ncbi:hypothetical protein CPC08DRAFT_704844 [Agrocybe pediades]|nr:hypothetical protein CPC08DRAFT_704844 [Agrocybe pediades]
MRQIQRYFNDDGLAATLVLFYHIGSHRFGPFLLNVGTFDGHSPSTPFYPLRDFRESDVLSLSCIWKDSSGLQGDNVYHRFVRQLLRDTLAGQSAEYALGPIVHARAALACFKVLAKMVPLPPPPSRKNIDIALIKDDAEDDVYPGLRFCPVKDNAEDDISTNLVSDSPNSGQWRFRYMKWLYDEELYFVLVGYLILLLPQCGRSDALVAACQDYTRLPDDPFQSDDRFPVRRRRLHEEMNKYLARVSQNI